MACGPCRRDGGAAVFGACRRPSLPLSDSPTTAHFGADAGHDHDYASLHSHQPDQTPVGGIALYSFEVSSAGPSIAMLTDAELESRLTPDPDAVLTLRAPEFAALRSASVSPLERPPRV